MATIKSLVERLETRLALVAGLDVQIHAEDRLIEFIRSEYIKVFEDHWMDDVIRNVTRTLDGTTGTVTTGLDTLIYKYKDIHSVFYDSDDDPLPRLVKGTNPSRIQMRCMGPSNDPLTVLKVYPIDLAGDIHIWYRSRVPDTAWTDGTYTTDLVIDEEVLLHGAMFRFLVDDGSNPEAEQTYAALYQDRLATLRQDQWTVPMPKRQQEYYNTSDRWQ